MWNETQQARFVERVLDTYDRGQVLKASGGTFQERVTPALPNPLANLQLGQRYTADVVSVFIDLRDFTSRSFWETPESVADLADAVLSGVALVVEELGGWVVGLRGDGLYAIFGLSLGEAPEVSVVRALAACAQSLDNANSGLNPALEVRGIEPVQLRAGADFGPVVFVRSGTETASEINPVGFTANFASKCEKYARSWEVVVGEGLAAYAPDAVAAHAERPKRYTRRGETKEYRFYQYHWRPLLSLVADLNSAVDAY